MSTPVELLVHISAPSRLRDDNRYRQQALGYVGFQPATRHDLSLQQSLASTRLPDIWVRSSDDVKENVEDTAQCARDEIIAASPTRQLELELNVSSTPDFVHQHILDSFSSSLSFKESSDTENTPTICIDRTPYTTGFSAAHAPICRPRRVKSENDQQTYQGMSHPQARNATLEFDPAEERIVDSFASVFSTIDRPQNGSPTSIIHVGRTPSITRSATVPPSMSPSARPKKRHRSLSNSWEPPPSVVPDSQPSQQPGLSPKRSSNVLSSPSSVTGSPSLKRQKRTTDRESQERVCEEEPASYENNPSNQNVAIQENRLRVRASRATTTDSSSRPPPSFEISQGNSIASLLRPRKSRKPPQSSPSKDKVPHESLSFSFTSSSTPLPIDQIHPPQPPTSLNPFTTHITSTLALIETKLPLGVHFKPKTTTRQLRTLERGHWRLLIPRDTCIHGRDQVWSSELCQKFWSFLESFVGQGRAGWGVWCERFAMSEAAEKVHPRGLTKGRLKEGTGGEDGEDVGDEALRVWCWGEVVAYIYLALIIASERKIKRLGAEWLDAGGQVIIQMP